MNSDRVTVFGSDWKLSSLDKNKYGFTDYELAIYDTRAVGDKLFCDFDESERIDVIRGLLEVIRLTTGYDIHGGVNNEEAFCKMAADDIYRFRLGKYSKGEMELAVKLNELVESIDSYSGDYFKQAKCEYGVIGIRFITDCIKRYGMIKKQMDSKINSIESKL